MTPLSESFALPKDYYGQVRRLATSGAGASGVPASSATSNADWDPEGDSAISVSRGLFEMFFFILITILMLSMVSGIIIDTFGSIRDTNLQRQTQLSNFDFISGLPVEDIKKSARRLGAPKGYQDHAANRQYMWDYSSFIYYVQTKKTMDLTGPESTVKTLVERKDHRWIPSSRCMLSERAEAQDVEAEEDEQRAWDKVEARVIATIERSNEKLAKILREQLQHSRGQGRGEEERDLL